MGSLKRIGKGAYSSVYEHPCKADYVLIISRDKFKEMLEESRTYFSYECLAHIPELTCVCALEYDTVYECKRYVRLTKKHWPKAYADYLEIIRYIHASPDKYAYKIAYRNYASVKHSTALTALWEFSTMASNCYQRALLDYSKRNFMVDQDTGELVLNDLFFEP